MLINEYSLVDLFEKTIAKYSGAKYAVAVDSCTSALFLSLMYFQAKDKEITVPAKTYISVPCSIIHAGGIPIFKKQKWSGIYQLSPLPIIDGALRFTKNMYVKDTLHCLSFHIKKHLKIGKGGMILTDSIYAYKWLKLARYNGREGKDYMKERFRLVGWNCYMTPEDAARGLRIFKTLPSVNKDIKNDYQDLSKYKFTASGMEILDNE
jgi:dTDP-4-amino-4,6-dideoxygalactose transaminase